ncbi:MAG: DUF2794 domain-containing protein [Proteobacteria bacterium]|nr:DUF2794 domain-containing protein [Pseudomonadota bacterium]
MANLIRLSDRRRLHRRIFFTRRELNLLLGVYSRKVSSGEWRDYAIDHQPGMAVFSIFRSSLERPLFAIAKCAGVAQRSAASGPAHGPYVVFSGRQKLKQGKTLEEVVDILDRRLELVTG